MTRSNANTVRWGALAVGVVLVVAALISMAGFCAGSALVGPRLICSFHPSQQNTFTGRLTPEMLDQVLARARELAGD